jgi:probable phosphomutase (TIGR03848 family)
MTQILLIRHGEHAAGMHVLVGRSDGIGLSEKGRKQAADLGERLAKLPIRAVYASPLLRTVETARAIAEPHALEVKTCDNLLEVDFGDWTGKTFEQLRQQEEWRSWNARRSVSRAPNGEFMPDCQARAVKGVLELVKKHPDQCIAAVSHGDIIRALAAHFLGVHLDLFVRIEVSLASVTVISFTQAGPRFIRLNNTGEVSLEA